MHAVKRHFGPVPRGGLPIIVAQVVAALLVVGWLLHEQGVRLPFTGEDSVRFEVPFADAGGLRTDHRAPVLVNGVPSGRVERVREQDGRAIATVRLDPAAAGIVRRDATATIEPRSALQDLTLALDPGSPSAPPVEDGDRLGPQAGKAPVELDRVVSVLDADTRAHVALVLDQLAVAARERPGAVRDALEQLRPAVDAIAPVVDGLDARREQLARLITAVDRLATAAGRQDQALRAAVRRGRQTVDAVASQDAALRAAVTRLPATLRSIERSLAATEALGTDLDPALTRLRPVAEDLPGALDAARDVVPEASQLLADVRRLAADGGAPARRLRRLSADLAPALRLLEQPTADAGQIVREVDERKDGVGKLGERFSGVLSTNDGLGPVLRGLGAFEPFDPVNLGFRKDQRAQAGAAAVRALTQTCQDDVPLACLVRYLVPGLPGSVR